MAIWKELRCDVFGPDCYSRLNSGPMGFDQVPALRRDGRKAGWRHKDEQDICPACMRKPR